MLGQETKAILLLDSGIKKFLAKSKYDKTIKKLEEKLHISAHKKLFVVVNLNAFKLCYKDRIDHPSLNCISIIWPQKGTSFVH